MKLHELLIIMAILLSSWYTAYIFGVNSVNKEPLSDYIIFSDYQSNYRLHKGTQYRTEHINNELGECWYIVTWHGDNQLIIEYTDTFIDGEYVSGSEWVESFIMNFGGIK